MRVAVISHTYVVGSNRGKFERLTESCGMDLLLVVPRVWRNRDINNVIDVDASQGSQYQTVIVPSWPTSFASLTTYSPITLFRVLRGFRPDLIYLEEEPWTLAALELCIFSFILRTRLVFFTWDNLGRWFPGPPSLIRRLMLWRADGAIAGNQEAKRLLMASRFAKPISVIPQLGIDPFQFSPNSSPKPNRAFVVGYIGRLVPQKGVMILLEAVSRIQGANLLLLGRGPLERQLLDRAQSLGLHRRFELCQGVPHHEVPKHLHRMSVLVLPSLTTSRWKEQFGHVLIEAMACGVTVIGTDSGAIPEVIGEAGIVVKEGSVDELSSALLRLKDDVGLLSTLRSKGQAKVEAEYTNYVIAKKLAQFLMAM